MTRELTATCRFCGQSIFVEVTDSEITLAKGQEEYKGMSDAEIISVLARVKALKKCSCEGANNHKKQEIRRNFEGFVVRRNFEGFVGGDLLNFLDLHKLEEIQVMDCHGNKAKLRKKGSSVDVTKTLKDA